MISWDEWRARYATATLDEHKTWAREFAAAYPDQHHFTTAAVAEFLAEFRPGFVVELGGFDGALAAAVLPDAPWVQRWQSWDYADDLALVCQDVRFEAPYMTCWPWEIPTLAKADALVLSHVIEHMTWADAGATLDAFKGDAIYVDAPLTDDDGERWTGFTGTHILEIGWPTLQARIEALGFECIAIRDGMYGRGNIRSFVTTRE